MRTFLKHLMNLKAAKWKHLTIFLQEELNEICIMDEEQRLEHLPMLKFCDEAEILQVAVHDASNFKSSVFVCELCGRPYKRKCFFDKHIVLCGKYIKFCLFVCLGLVYVL